MSSIRSRYVVAVAALALTGAAGVPGTADAGSHYSAKKCVKALAKAQKRYNKALKPGTSTKKQQAAARAFQKALTNLQKKHGCVFRG